MSEEPPTFQGVSLEGDVDLEKTPGPRYSLINLDELARRRGVTRSELFDDLRADGWEIEEQVGGGVILRYRGTSDQA